MKNVLVLGLLFLSAGPGWAQTAEKEATPTADPRAQFEKITQEYGAAMNKFWEAFQTLKDDDERQKYYAENYPKPDGPAKELMSLVRENAGKPIGFESINWMLQNRVQGAMRSEALGLLADHYLDNPALPGMLGMFAFDPDPANGEFLEKVIAKSDKREMKGAAHYHLAKHLMARNEMANFVKLAGPEEKKQMEAFLGKEAIASLANVDAKKLEARSEALLDKVTKEFADLPGMRSGTLGDAAKRDLFELRNLSVGKVAPEIEGEDIFGKNFKLSEYRGKIIFLDFWGNW